MKLKNLFFCLMTVLISGGCNTAQTTRQLTVASYNLRYDNPSDSLNGNGWDARYPVIAQIIQFNDFDVVGTQEGFAHQLEDLKGALSGYEYFGVGRDDGKHAGEHSAIFYRTDKLEVLNKGDFWLSETPDVPSKGWDAVLPRICSWGHFRYKDTGFEFLFFNLHMDHIGVQARVESVLLVQEKMKEFGPELPAILTGDFNVDQFHDSYQAFVGNGVWRDAHDVADVTYAPTGTTNTFNPNHFTESRIDHVFVSPAFHVKRYGVLTDTYRREVENKDGDSSKKTYEAKVPSDHFPVKVVLEYAK